MLAHRRNNLIGDDVIHEIGTHGAGKTQIIRLHRRRPVGKNRRTAAFGEAHQIDSDIGFVSLHERRNVRIAFPADIDEPVKSSVKPRAHGTAIIRTERYRNRFKTGPVMSLEHTGHQCRQSMGMKIRRHISEADPPMDWRPSMGQCGCDVALIGHP